MLSFIIGLVAFYLNYIWGFFTLESTIMALVTGQLFPLTFFPDKVVMILKLTPFYYMNFIPVSILLNQFYTISKYILLDLNISLRYLVIL